MQGSKILEANPLEYTLEETLPFDSGNKSEISKDLIPYKIDSPLSSTKTIKIAIETLSAIICTNLPILKDGSQLIAITVDYNKGQVECTFYHPEYTSRDSVEK